ncbi:MAG: hypothetical protein R3321_11470, partial [Nitrososphaeraceae archaeon]|nr:hypothetical protein [Nitrososphaeraceae archaeon]
MKPFVLLFSFFFFSSLSIYAQTTINIPADYPTIQEGINAAVDGDIVLVAEGTYTENIHFKGKTITVASLFFVDGDTSHIRNTIIDGSQPSHPDSGAVVTIDNGSDSSTVLSGFTIHGGTGNQYGAFRWGGGVDVGNSSPTISYNIIEYNTITGDDIVGGSALFAAVGYGGSLIFENNIVRNNYSESTGNSATTSGAVEFGYQSKGLIIIRKNNIYANTATGANAVYGAGIMVGGLNNPGYVCYIENNKIYDNTIITTTGSNNQLGGGIHTYNLQVYIRNNLIANNSAKYGGGIFYYNALSPAPVSP